MTNWKEEIDRHKNQLQSEFDSKLEIIRLGNLERINQIHSIISNHYENEFLLGYKVLNRYNIREKLEEIRDQIWGGEIKGINSLDDYYCKVIETITTESYDRVILNLEISPYSLKDQNYLDEFKLTREDKYKIDNQLSKEPAQYTLIKPKLLVYTSGTGYDNCKYEEIEEVSEILSISYNGKNIFIRGPEYTLTEIKLENNNDSEINNLIKNALVGECAFYKTRREITKKMIEEHPELIIAYNRRKKF